MVNSLISILISLVVAGLVMMTFGVVFLLAFLPMEWFSKVGDEAFGVDTLDRALDNLAAQWKVMRFLLLSVAALGAIFLAGGLFFRVVFPEHLFVEFLSSFLQSLATEFLGAVFTFIVLGYFFHMRSEFSDEEFLSMVKQLREDIEGLRSLIEQGGDLPPKFVPPLKLDSKPSKGVAAPG